MENIITNETDYNNYKLLRPVRLYLYKKVKFICSQCGQCKEKTFRALTPQLICNNCSYSNTQNKAEVKKKKSQTVLNRYGYTNIGQCPEIKEKVKSTNQSKYGTDYYSQTDEYKIQVKETSLIKYSVENYAQTDECKEKIKETNLIKYGVDHYSKTAEYKEKVKETTLNKYGVEYYTQSDDYNIKSQNTCQSKYGVDHYSQTDEYKIQVKETSLIKYGTEHYAQSDECKEKTKQICIQKYGVESFPQTNQFKNTIHKISINKLNKRLNKYNIIVLSKMDNVFNLICSACNGHFSYNISTVYQFLNHYNNSFCPHCSRIVSTNKSLKEKEVANYIKTIYNGTVIENDRTILHPKELDIYLPDLKLAFEFDGTYWHADPRFFTATDIITKSNKTAQEIWDYDKQKEILCEQQQIKLIRIKEYDWNSNPEETKSLIKSYLV